MMNTLLAHPALALLARVLLTFPFWGSGLDKLTNFAGATAEMQHFGLEPAALIAVLVILTQIGGSVLIILNRLVWLGAGALGVFTALTIFLVHRFWALEGAASLHAFHTAAEHVGMIGGLITVSVLAAFRGPAAAGETAQLAGAFGRR